MGKEKLCFLPFQYDLRSASSDVLQILKWNLDFSKDIVLLISLLNLCFCGGMRAGTFYPPSCCPHSFFTPLTISVIFLS